MRISLLLAFAAVLSCCASGVQAQWPADQCGWPFLFEGAVNTPTTVKLAQGLLNQVLDGTQGYTPLAVDGVFGHDTYLATAYFQRSHSVTNDRPGAMAGKSTWEALTLAAVINQKTGSAITTGYGVEVLQIMLNFNGYPVNVTKKFDNATKDALAKFQKDYGSPVTSGTAVTGYTWHLLATGCNKPGGQFWFDAGWPQGQMTSEMFSCLYHNASMRFAIFECWVEQGAQGSFWSECVGNIQRARAAGFGNKSVGVYMFPQRFAPAAQQVTQLLGNLSTHFLTKEQDPTKDLAKEIPIVMLDIEGDTWSKFTQAENRDFMKELKATFDAHSMKLAVYCGREWATYFGSDFTDFKDSPLIYAHYDNVPGYYDFYPAYGGWTKPSGKQFWDGTSGEQVCGTGGLDWDWSAKPFW